MREGLLKYEGTTPDAHRGAMAKGRMKPLSELAPGIALSCILSGAEPETALQTHFLHEYGGNIGKYYIVSTVKNWGIITIM